MSFPWYSDRSIADMVATCLRARRPRAAPVQRCPRGYVGARGRAAARLRGHVGSALCEALLRLPLALFASTPKPKFAYLYSCSLACSPSSLPYFLLSSEAFKDRTKRQLPTMGDRAL